MKCQLNKLGSTASTKWVLGLVVAVSMGCAAQLPDANAPSALDQQFAQANCPVKTPDGLTKVESLQEWRSLLGANAPKELQQWASSFGDHQILVYQLGQRRTGGFSVSFSKVELKKGGKDALAWLTFTAPESGSIVTQAITQPCAIALVSSKTLGAVSLLDSKTGEAVKAQQKP